MRRLLSFLATASVGGAIAVLPAVAAHAAALPVSALSAVGGDSQVSLTWTDPVPAPARVVVRELPGSAAPALPTDGTDVPVTSATTAVAGGLAPATVYSFSVFTSDGTTFSAPVSITAGTVAATTMGIGVAPATVTYGKQSVVSGALRLAVTQAPVAGEKVTLYQRRQGSTTWVGWASAVTAADGTVRFPVSFGRNTEVELVHAVSAAYAAATSKVAPLQVNPLVVISAPALAKTFDVVTVSGRVLPPVARQLVSLQRYAGGWKTILTTRTSATGTYHFVLNPTKDVVYSLRTVLAADASHPSALSAKAVITVGDRDLVTGMHGPDVLALQQRLAVLHYDIGAVNGTYSYDTFHAVTAFEKVQGLTRDGNVTAKVRTALTKPKVPVLRFHDAGRSFEVDKTHQVVIMAVDGQINRIIDASTGFGGNYVYAGVTYQAITPEGNYTVQRKINGVRVSHLGVLYRPAYFFEGYAIHGEGLVPSYPASHGCVRITVPAMDRLYDLLAIGTPVHVYH